MVPELTSEEAKKLFRYDDDIGLLYWRVDRGTSIKAGMLAGSLHTSGYLSVQVSGKGYRVHRVIWLIVTGDWPKHYIDHINRDRQDNRIRNLRDVTSSENALNRGTSVKAINTRSKSKVRYKTETENLTITTILTYLKYDKKTGVLRRAKSHNRWKIDEIAGNIDKYDTYVRVQILGKIYLAHRLIWFIEYGKWPSLIIDHVNGIKSDNRLENLREVSKTENNFNTGISKKNSSGIKGVHWDKSKNKWMASIGINCKTINLGGFINKEDAGAAYTEALKKYLNE